MFLLSRLKRNQTGTLVWEAIDRKRSVQQIYDYLKNNSPENTGFDELEERLTKYIMNLYEKRLISFKQLINT